MSGWDINTAETFKLSGQMISLGLAINNDFLFCLVLFSVRVIITRLFRPNSKRKVNSFFLNKLMAHVFRLCTCTGQ